MTFTARRNELLGTKKEMHLSTFLWALLVAAVFFIPYILIDRGYFLFYGDFNVQQIPFYQLCHQAIRGGEIGWNWTTDLGANFIGSYTFYTIGSPFFWLTLPFPTEWVPYLMGPLLILKFACSALTAYCYIRRFTRTPDAARLGALLYAFSGFSVYNIFFNHFHEAIVFFPLLLLSVEEMIVENRRGFFAAMVAITAISNYFFFYGMVVFVVIYWFVRTFSRCYKIRPARFFWFCFEAVLGLAISAAFMLPTIAAVLGNSRLSEISVGWGAIMYGKEQIYLNIFECFFFPPDLPARPVFFPEADVKWSSLGGWLPLFSMVGVFACLQQKKRTWQRRLLGISIFMALVPILNCAFYLFNNAYYARWYYMPILIMSLVTVQCVEDHDVDWSVPYKWVTGITIAAVFVIGCFPREMENNKITKWGLFTNTDDFYLYRFLATSAIAIVSLLILGLLLRILKQHRKQFMRTATAMVCVISVIYAAYFVGTGKTHSYESDIMIDDLIESKLELPGDPETYRIDVYEGVDNTGMYLGYSTINAFHSVVPTSVTEFWEYVGEERGVASRPETKSFAARSLLGVKYLLAREGGDSFTDELGAPLMAGFSFYSHEDGYDVYLNENACPYGFAYEYYMTKAQCEHYEEEKRSNMMLKAMLLNDEQIAKYGGLMKNLSQYESDDLFDPYSDPAYGFYCDEEELAIDTAALNSQAISSFDRTKTGFEAEISLTKDNLVFFSIPYDEGWSAKVNGEPVEIEKVNVGFMAVPVSAGENTITFTYNTPGLALGVRVTFAAVLIWIIYSSVYLILRCTRGAGHLEYPEGKQLLERFRQEEAEERLLAASEVIEMEDTEEERPSAPQDNESFYRYSGNTEFKRGFWVNMNETQSPPETDSEKKE